MSTETEKKEQILLKYSFWEKLSQSEKEMLLKGSLTKQFSKNQMICSDESCKGLIFVLKGSVRACLVSDKGREVTLFRVFQGDFCVTTTTGVIQQITFDTIISAGEDTALMIVPSSICSSLMESNIYFRSFMFEKETERFSQAIWVIQQLLFRRFDQRLASYLLSQYEATGETDLKLTQENIARDVNSAREVVARMLHHFSNEGLVEIRRGHIILLDIQGLKDLG